MHDIVMLIFVHPLLHEQLFQQDRTVVASSHVKSRNIILSEGLARVYAHYNKTIIILHRSLIWHANGSCTLHSWDVLKNCKYAVCVVYHATKY